MDIKPIKTEQDYERTLERIDEIMDATYGSAEGDELDVLVTLVEAYETDKYDIPDASPVEAIKFVMDQRGLQPKDLIPIFGTSGRVSEVLNHRRSLSIQMIRRLHSVYDIPAEVLIKQDSLEAQGTSMQRTRRGSSTGEVITAAKRKAAKNKKTTTKKKSVGKRKSAQRD